MRRKKVLIGILAVFIAVGVVVSLIWFTAFRGQSNIAVVRVGVLPDQEEAELRRRYTPLLNHLIQATGLKFELAVPDSYEHLLRIFGDRQIELAYFGGLTFVRAQSLHGASPLVMREVDTRFTSYFVARADGPLRDCDNLDCGELAGKAIAFGSKLSTSGHLMPRSFLKSEIGIEPEAYFREVLYTGAHDATVHRTLDGSAHLGVVNSEIYRTMLRDGRLALGELRILWETPPYPDYVWAVGGQLEEGIQTKIRDAFLMLEMGNEDHARILSLMGTTHFLPAGTDDFQTLKLIAESLGMLARVQP